MESSVDDESLMGDLPRKKVEIQIVSDVSCPWCWLSKRRLDEAMASLEHRIDFTVEWVPFLLKPSIPPEGVPNEDHNNTDSLRVQSLKELGTDLGLEFNFSCPINPSTLPCHVMLDFVKERYGIEAQTDVIETMFKAYFTQGMPLDKTCIMNIARAFGINTTRLSEALEDTARVERVRTTAGEWRKKGIQAVPFFIMNGHSACSGAQNVRDFISTILKVADKFAPDGLQHQEGDLVCIGENA